MNQRPMHCFGKREKNVTFILAVFWNKRVTEINFEAFDMSVKDRHGVFVPVWTALSCRPTDIVHGLHSSFIMISTDSSTVLMEDVLKLRGNIHVTSHVASKLIFKSRLSSLIGTKVNFVMWNFSLFLFQMSLNVTLKVVFCV